MCFTLALLTLAPACSYSKFLADDSVEYNRDLATSHQQLLLLNIVRASRRDPMYFTSASSVTQSIEGSFGVGLEAQLFALNSEKASGNIAGKSSPTIVTGVLDSAEFMRGITKQIDMSTFVHYWNQGWPRELLLHLLVREIKVGGETYTNYPPDRNAMTQFQHYASILARGELSADTRDEDVGPVLSTCPSTDDIVGAFKSKLFVKAAKCTACKDKDGTCEACTGFQVYQRTAFWKWTPGEDYPGDAGLIRPQEFRDATDVAVEDGSDLSVYLRSPQAVLYYLGEIVRAQLRPSRDLYKIRTRPYGPEFPLFVVDVCGKSCGPCPIKVSYCGKTYQVPEGKAGGRSMQALALISQLLAIHKSAKELPKSQLVTLTNR